MYNPNYVGGDIIGGASSLKQLLFRPRFAVDPYFTGIPGTYLCSASTPPGQVHTACAAPTPPPARSHGSASEVKLETGRHSLENRSRSSVTEHQEGEPVR